jgi:hypothetical protein
MNKSKNSLIGVAILMIVALMAGPAIPAVMTGTITDSKTGEPLPGDTIMIKGTYFGASTNVDGNYKVANIKSGTYTIEVSLISYKMIQKTGVHFEENDSVNIDFKLEPSVLTLGKDIVVIGEKPMLDIGATESRSTIGADQIKNLVVENATDLLKNQSGVVVAGDEIHIRGGRAYENAYLIDGISIQDPYSGGTSGFNITAGAIEEFEVLTGDLMPNMVRPCRAWYKRKPKRFLQKYRRLSYKTDNFGLFKNQR